MLFLTLASVVALLLIVRTALRYRQDGPRALAAPSGLLLLYVATASAVPTYWMFTSESLLAPVNTMSDETPLLMGLGILGFAVGASLPFRRIVGQTYRNAPSLLPMAGRALLLLPLALALHGALTGYAENRGANQDVRTLADSLTVVSEMVALVGILLILVGAQHRRLLMAWYDWLAVVALIVLQGYNGNRGTSLAICLMLVIAWLMTAATPSRRTAVKIAACAVLIPIGVALASSQVLNHRAAALDRGAAERGVTPVEMVVRDWESVPFTVGETRTYTDEEGLRHGSTILAAAVRQLPAPLSVPLLGPVDDTGTYVFREITQAPDSHGWGFSIIAEGVLNFGRLGAFLVPFAFGAALAWLYSRADLTRWNATSLIYLIAAASTPMAWRSDLLGVVKATLYPFIALVLITTAVRLWERRRAKRLEVAEASV